MSISTRLFVRPLQAIARPFVAWNYSSGIPTRLSVGTPSDDPHGAIAGPNPYSLLVAGGIGGAAIGVHTFQQSLARQFAATLSRSTGRGVDWESLAWPSLRLASTVAGLNEIDALPSFDVVMVLPGVADALAFTNPRKWQRDLERLLDHLAAVAAPDATILVGEVQPVARYVQVGRFISSMLDAHARILNLAARRTCLHRRGVHVVRLPMVERTDYVGDIFSYSTLYRRWGKHLGELLPSLRNPNGDVA